MADEEFIYQDKLSWRLDAVANLVRASAEISGPLYAKERAEILLMIKIARQSIEPKVPHAERMVTHLLKSANAKSGDVSS
jgi:hypothetical protein